MDKINFIIYSIIIAIFTIIIIILHALTLSNNTLWERQLQNERFINLILSSKFDTRIGLQQGIDYIDGQSVVNEKIDRENVIDIIKKTWRKDWKIGVAIGDCESKLKSNARHINTNGTVDVSIFQINSIHKLDVTDIVANASFAYILYREQGTNPWKSSKKCWENK